MIRFRIRSIRVGVVKDHCAGGLLGLKPPLVADLDASALRLRQSLQRLMALELRAGGIDERTTSTSTALLQRLSHIAFVPSREAPFAAGALAEAFCNGFRRLADEAI